MALNSSHLLSEALSLVQQCLGLTVKADLVAAMQRTRCSTWIACGLSQAAAASGRYLAGIVSSKPAILLSPLSVRKQLSYRTLPIIVTYRGKNRDIQAIAKHLSTNGQRTVTIICGFESHAAGRILQGAGVRIYQLTAPPHREDRDFVAVRALLALTALCTNLVLSIRGDMHRCQRLSNWLVEMAAVIHDQAIAAATRIAALPSFQDRTWIVLTAGSAEPVKHAYQSLCGEAGIANVCAFDAKDYTHGAYHSALVTADKTLLLILTDEQSHKLGTLLDKRLGSLVPTIHISFSGNDEETMWAHFLAASYIVGEMAAARAQSLRNPPKPAAERCWTTWGSI